VDRAGRKSSQQANPPFPSLIWTSDGCHIGPIGKAQQAGEACVTSWAVLLHNSGLAVARVMDYSEINVETVTDSLKLVSMLMLRGHNK